VSFRCVTSVVRNPIRAGAAAASHPACPPPTTNTAQGAADADDEQGPADETTAAPLLVLFVARCVLSSPFVRVATGRCGCDWRGSKARPLQLRGATEASAADQDRHAAWQLALTTTLVRKRLRASTMCVLIVVGVATRRAFSEPEIQNICLQPRKRHAANSPNTRPRLKDARATHNGQNRL